MSFYTINPATEEKIKQYHYMSQRNIENIAQEVDDAFQIWKKIELQERAQSLLKLAEALRKNAKEYARLMTEEMGKPIQDSLAEIEKCAWTAEVYAQKGPAWLKEETIAVDGKQHLISFDPLGVIVLIMPWNFPFWQALRAAIPIMLTGNACLMKHAENVTGCALAIEQVFIQAGFPKNSFRTIVATHEDTAFLIKQSRVRGISLTGSTRAGQIVGGQAGQHLKKVVLELGGSDPFIVLSDVDVDWVASQAVKGRFQNCGQSCIAAKRFIVHESIAPAFSKKFAELTAQLKMGDPLDQSTQIGPLVNQKALETVCAQVEDAIQKGAQVLTGGKPGSGQGFFYEPTVLAQVTDQMAVLKEEVFAPVAPVVTFQTEAQAIEIANRSEFGLGGSVWTKDLEKGLEIARQIESGTVFVNSITKSDPRMPFGGIKESGLGRELSHYGLKEFVNVKGLNVYEHG